MSATTPCSPPIPTSLGLGGGQCRRGQDLYPGQSRGAAAAGAMRKPEKILCLTFTKAAAAEMQDRLFEQLGEWAMLPDDGTARRASQRSAPTPDDLPKARRLFAQALETPGGLKILTLHAFCQIVLSRFPLEAGVPPGFDVLDDAVGARADRRGAPERAGARRHGRREAGGRGRPAGDGNRRGAAQRHAGCGAGQRPAQAGPVLCRMQDEHCEDAVWRASWRGARCGSPSQEFLRRASRAKSKHLRDDRATGWPTAARPMPRAGARLARIADAGYRARDVSHCCANCC